MLKQPVRTSLSDFIKTTMGSQFVIPVYQRIYTWNPEKETARFMSDLEDLLEARTDNHFLGIIIYIESKISAMFRQLQIVDGQQRMTTTFIFLLALKKIAEERRERDIAGMINDYYLYNRHTSQGAALRLKPAVSTDDVYARLVYGSDRDLTAKERESSVYRNYQYIRKRILELSRNYSLLEILDCLNRMDILEFPLSETDNAQQIYESINSTGAPLTSADLIRNYVLMNHTDDDQEHYYKFYWEPLEEQYPESRKLEEFFRFYLAVKTYDLYSRKDVYEGFKKYWSHRSEDTETKLREINRYCRYYHDIYEGHCENPDAEKALADFRRSDYRMPAPFLMEMYRLFEEGLISSREFAAQVRLIDSYMIRRALCGIDTSPLARYFPSLLRAVMSAYNRGGRSDIIAITRECLISYNRGKALAMPTDKELKAKMREINAYSLMCLRPVLDRLEHHGSHARVDLSELNIEHIMPQHPNNWWKKNCGAETDDDYTFHANLIGNLTLCAEYDNSRMGNEDFAFKKKVLAATSHIRLNENILKMKHWTVEDILKRCDELAVRIIEIYPYNGANNEGVRRTVQVTSKDIIVLNTPTVSARAFYHHNNDIEILNGTMMKAYQETDMKKFLAVFRDLYDREILKEMDGGKVVFESSAHFASLSEAASFLMHRGGDNRSAWTYEDGSEIQDKPMPEKKPEKKVVKKTAQHARKAIAERRTARKASAVRKTVNKAEPEAPRKVEVRRFEKKTAVKEEG